MSNRRHGAYGFALRGVEEAAEWMLPAPSDWPDVEIAQANGYPAVRTEISRDRATIRLLGSRAIRLTRDPPSVLYEGPSDVSIDALVHPYFAPAAAVLANWQGWNTFHAGGFESDGLAWIVTAEREGGKSSTLAALSQAGYPILADDLIVLKDRKAFSGPRSIDLREDPQFGEPTYLGVVGERQRWRMALGPVQPELPVAGVIKLSWSDSARIQSVRSEDRMRVLAPALSLPTSPASFLSVLSLPTYAVSRPRGSLEDTVALVEEVTGVSDKTTA